MSFLNADVLHDCEDENTPGIEETLYLVCSCDVDVYPDVLATTAPGDSMILDGDIVLKAGKKFIKFKIISDTGEIKNTLVGVRSSKSYVQTMDGKTVNNDVIHDEFFNKNRNACVIALFKEKSGALRVMGTLGSPAYFETAESISGTNNESARDWTFQLKASPGNVAYHYQGLIDLTA